MTDTITSRDQIVGWEAIAPVHKHSPAMAHAIEQVEITWRLYNDAVNRWMDGKGRQSEVDAARSAAEKADELKHRIYLEENECTCKPDGDACPVCAKYLEAQPIPY